MEIRDATADDVEAILDVRTLSFGALPAAFRDMWFEMQDHGIRDHRSLIVTEGARVIGAARIHDYRQWWHGEAQAMGGIAGVTIAPDARNRGVGTALMRAILARCAEQSYAISVLHPATVPAYRRVGYECGGVHRTVTLPSDELRRLAPPRSSPEVGIRRLASSDAGAVDDLLGELHRRHRDCGPIAHPAGFTARYMSEPTTVTYAAEDGLLMYSIDDEVLDVDVLMATTEMTARLLAAIVGSGSSTHKSTKITIAGDDPLVWLVGDQPRPTISEEWWMLRIVDPIAAFARRGYPADADVEVGLSLVDEAIPANEGTYRLTVSAGQGMLTRSAVGAGIPILAVSERGLGALFCGWPVRSLQRAGLCDELDATIAARLDAALTARPFMLDHF